MQKTDRINIRIDHSDKTAMEREAGKHGFTLSQFVRWLWSAHMRRQARRKQAN